MKYPSRWHDGSSGGKQNQSDKLLPVNYESLIQTQDAVSASLMKGGEDFLGHLNEFAELVNEHTWADRNLAVCHSLIPMYKA